MSPLDDSVSPRGQFTTTHWSVVLRAGQDSSTQAQDALARLCQTYWYPLYAYLRRQGRSPEDAQDLVQEFFARLLEKHWLRAVAPEKGRFRSFLLVSLKHFVANEWDKMRAQKRGGGQTVVSLDAQSAEERYRFEPVDRLSADKIYERRWALTLLDRVLARLRDEQAAAGKGALFDALKEGLTGGRDSVGYADHAARLGLSEGALKVAAHRLRRRYRELLREELSQTVASAEDVEAELRALQLALSQ
ncbi:MAG: sigma-70 family RNA polymerase sigma factor [Verrucomicrobia bacterium]|nr:sigma-70 family RNA polymerase sigma factor [Verrucomicrobiota bacterium]